MSKSQGCDQYLRRPNNVCVCGGGEDVGGKTHSRISQSKKGFTKPNHKIKLKKKKILTLASIPGRYHGVTIFG